MDRYKVVKRLGVGTYGSAYLVCLKQDPNQLFVLKKVKLDENEKDKAKSESEVAVLMQLDHPLMLWCAPCGLASTAWTHDLHACCQQEASILHPGLRMGMD
jgi:hypothetical protein